MKQYYINYTVLGETYTVGPFPEPIAKHHFKVLMADKNVTDVEMDEDRGVIDAEAKKGA